MIFEGVVVGKTMRTRFAAVMAAAVAAALVAVCLLVISAVGGPDWSYTAERIALFAGLGGVVAALGVWSTRDRAAAIRQVDALAAPAAGNPSPGDVPPGRARTRSWVSVLAAAALNAVCMFVIAVTGGEDLPSVAVRALAGAGIVAVWAAMLMASTAELRSSTAALQSVYSLNGDSAPAPAGGVDPLVPDGYVVAYQRGGQLGAGDAVLQVAAIPADRWDLRDAAWQMTIVSGVGGLAILNHSESFDVFQAPRGGALRALRRGMLDGTLITLTQAQQVLAAHGARDVTVPYARRVGG